MNDKDFSAYEAAFHSVQRDGDSKSPNPLKLYEAGLVYGRRTADLPPLWEDVICEACCGTDGPVLIVIEDGECPNCHGTRTIRRPIHYTVEKFRAWEKETGREPVELGTLTPIWDAEDGYWQPSSIRDKHAPAVLRFPGQPAPPDDWRPEV